MHLYGLRSNQSHVDGAVVLGRDDGQPQPGMDRACHRDADTSHHECGEPTTSVVGVAIASTVRARELLAKQVLGMGDIRMSGRMPSGHFGTLMPENMYFIDEAT